MTVAPLSSRQGLAVDTAFPQGRVIVDGRVITYRECGREQELRLGGSGPSTVLLLHGISSGAASWADCALAMQSQARVVAWDAPGYGLSTPLESAQPGALDYAGQIDVLLDGLGIQSCVLVGHSLGALMASAFNQLASSRIQSLVLLSPALGYGAPSRQERGQAVRTGRLTALAEKGIESIAEALPQRLLTSDATAQQRGIVNANALALNEAGYRQAVELLCTDDIDRYAVDATRTWVYCGENDVVTTPEQSAAYAERHDLPFGLIASAGHACYVEQPERTAELILNALPREGSQALCK